MLELRTTDTRYGNTRKSPDLGKAEQIQKVLKKLSQELPTTQTDIRRREDLLRDMGGLYASGDFFTYPNLHSIGDRMQGCENEVIILSVAVTDANRGNFMCDYRRLNVLMSRARCSLIILAGGEALLGRNWWQAQAAPPLDQNNENNNKHPPRSCLCLLPLSNKTPSS